MPRPKKSSTAPSVIDKFVSEELRRLNVTKNSSLQDLELFDFLVKASPSYEAPEHLSGLLPYFKSIEERPMFFSFSAPPRHGKSVLTNHFVARHMLRHPGVRVAYGCYSLDLSAGFFSDEVKDILVANGVPVDRSKNTKEEWRLENGSSFKAVAPGSGFTGRGADLIIIDDPYKDRGHAESGKIRETTWNWITDVCFTRRSPSASVVVTHTRWHYEDVIGRMEREHSDKVTFLPFPAINAQGTALWEKMWPAERLVKEVRPIIGEYAWSALYMCNPIPQGGAVFKGTTLYTESDLPKTFKKIVIGIDCAYTKRTHSDYSSAVVLGVGEDGNHYVLKVVRKQCESAAFGVILKQLRKDFGSPPVYWFTGGQEKVIADYLTNTCGVPIKAIPAKEDKFARSQAVASAWNAGMVQVPAANVDWAQPFLNEVLSFSGMDDPHDDQVDALAAAYIPSAGKKRLRGSLNNAVLDF